MNKLANARFLQANKQKRYTAQTYPLVTVGAFILNAKNQILLINSYKWEGYFSVPGGKIQLGERMEDALTREVKEEVGLDVRVIKFLCPADAIYPKEFFKPRHFVFLDFLCKVKGNDIPKLDGKEMQGFEWADLDKALKKNLEPYAKETIEKYVIPFMKSKKL